MTVRIGLIGAGAIGERHTRALSAIPGCTLVTIASRTVEEAATLAARFGIPDTDNSLEAVLARPDVDAVILATPTQMHASQALTCIEAGKHVLVEIPIADSWSDAQALQMRSTAAHTLVMAAHTSRYYPSNLYLRQLIEAGQFCLTQMNAQTYFLRRSNLNAKGEPRVWTDHLLWHHAAHTVDLFAWQAGRIVEAQALQGPKHPELGIAMEMAIQLRSEGGALCTLSLSFNNDGPLGSTVRYIGDTGTYIARRLDLTDGHGKSIDLSILAEPEDGVEIQDRDFVNAILTGKPPTSTIESVFDCYRVIGEVAAQLQRHDGWH